MILVIDNYDSFTHNLVHLLRMLGGEVQVVRNDRHSAAELLALDPERVLISPGPGDPRAAGVSLELVAALPPGMPLLGVCLGHQVIAEAFGGQVVRSGRPCHGKTAAIAHDGAGLFAGLPSPITAARYHSLVVDRRGLPECLEVGAWLDADPTVVMGLRHRDRPIHGIQFHPESFMTPRGRDLVAAFMAIPRSGP